MKKDNYRPSPLASWILRNLIPTHIGTSGIGDYEELYRILLDEQGRAAADRWYLKQIGISIKAIIFKAIFCRFIMFKSYLKIIWRHLMKHKGYSFINIAGLAVGLTCCILILLYVKYEFSYDKYHKNSDNIYRVVMKMPGNNYMDNEWFNSAPGSLKATLMEEYPEIISSTRAYKKEGHLYRDNVLTTERSIFFIDPEFLKIFSFPLISGDPETVVTDPFAMLISQRFAEKYFKDEDPVGKTINLDRKHNFQITGVLQNCPENSHFTFDILASFNSLYTIRPGGKGRIEESGPNSWNTYIQLPDKYNPDDLEKKFPGVIKKTLRKGSKDEYHLQSLTSIHLHSNINFEIEANSDIRYVYLFSAIAFFIMLIACLNYMNLATARASGRFKEIGIRKVVGAGRHNIIRQFLGESMIYTITALYIAIILAKLLLPSFGTFIDRNLEYNILDDHIIFISLACFALIVGLISGSYPAFYMSALKPANIVKGTISPGSGNKHHSTLRNSLVISQFIISIVLLICSLTVYRQLDFIKNSKLGYIKDHIITGRIYDSKLKNNFEPLINELNLNPGILDVYVNGQLPITINSQDNAVWEGQKLAEGETPPLTFSGFVNYNFLDFFNLELIEGRNFSKTYSTDASQAFILNESAAKLSGWKNPIGKKYSLQLRDGIVIGVIKDFHNTSLRLKVKPMALMLNNWPSGDWAIKISSDNIAESMAFIGKKFKEFSPDYPFNYSFLDDKVNSIYKSEQKLGQIFSYFTFIAIIISCLGLFGLISYTAEQRTKEIGIRKVLGASVVGIVMLLSKDFIKWIITANVIAIPIAYFAMNKWLQNFAYRTDIEIFIFFSATLISLFIAVITVSFKTFNAAQTNPADTIKYE
ncbi:ABC transporter permease [bacterium]|nr:ABC transporter permease [bacterium]